MLAILELAQGSSHAPDALMLVAESAAKTRQGDMSSLLHRFLGESLCSVGALCLLLHKGAPSERYKASIIQLCTDGLAACARGAQATSAMMPSLGRPFQLMCVAARALISVLSEADVSVIQRHKLDNQSLFVLVICREVALALRGGVVAQGGGDANRALVALAASIARHAFPHVLLAPGAEEMSGLREAASWWALALLRDAAGSGGDVLALARPLLESLRSAEVQRASNTLITVAASLHDLGVFSQIDAQVQTKVLAELRGNAAPEHSWYVDAVLHAIQTTSLNGNLGFYLAGSTSTLNWLHRLEEVGHPGRFEGSASAVERSVPISGPPLMLYLRVLPSCHQRGKRHVALRVDVCNATTLTFRNVCVGVRMDRSSLLGKKDRTSWSSIKSQIRPCEQTIESINCRSSASLWSEIEVRSVQPLCISMSVSYDNVAPPGLDTGAADHPASANVLPDVWSDEEDSPRLHFVCHSQPLSMSVFFCPFRGFDSPCSGFFPPPMLFRVCPYSRQGPLADLGLRGFDLQAWQPAGLHKLPQVGCNVLLPDVQGCFAGLALDSESIFCLLIRGRVGGVAEVLEVRTSNEALLGEMYDNINFWVLASSN